MKKVQKGIKKGKKGLKKVKNGQIRVISPKRLKMINETIRALISTPNKTKASEMLGISDTALYKRLSKYPEINEGVKSFIDSVLHDSRRKINLASPIAVDKMTSLVNNAVSENVQLQASTEILDRSGIVKPQTNTNIQVNVLNDLKKLKDKYS